MHKIYRAMLFQSSQPQSAYQIFVEVQQAQRKLDECHRLREAYQTNHRSQALCICQNIADLSFGLALKPYPVASAFYDSIGALITKKPVIFACKTLSFIDSARRIN